MNSIGFIFGILFMCFTLKFSYAGGKNGVLGGKSFPIICFPVTQDATFTTTGQIHVLVAKYHFGVYPCTDLMDIDDSDYVNYFKNVSPTWIDFPFADDSSGGYSTIKFFGTSTVKAVSIVSDVKLYHLDITFNLIKGFIVAIPNLGVEYEIYAVNNLLHVASFILKIGSVTLKQGDIFQLLDKDKNKMFEVTITKTSVNYMDPQNSNGTIFTFISITKR